MKFTLTIKLGNDAMQTPADLATALQELSGLFEEYPDATGKAETDHGKIHDLNGNTVGTWAITEDK